MTAALAFTTAIVALLKAGPALAGGRVKRGRAIPMQLEHDTEIFVRLVRSQGRALDLAGLATRWQTLIGVEIAVRCRNGQDAHEAVDPHLEAVWARLAAAAVPAGADGWLLQPDVAWELAEADTPIATASLVLQITHTTGPATLAAFA